MARARPTSGQDRRRSLKVVVTGPYGAVRTTLIRSISEIPVPSTERAVVGNGDSPPVTERATTAATDSGRRSIDGMPGFVVMVDGTDHASNKSTDDTLAFFTEMAVTYVVAVNRVAGDNNEAVAQSRRELDIPDEVRVVACDTRDRESVKAVLVELCQAVLDGSASAPTKA